MGFLDFIIEKGLISQNEASNILNKSETPKEGVEQALFEKGVKPDEFTRLKAEYFNVPTRTLDDAQISHDLLKYIPEDSASFYKFVPIGLQDGVLEIGLVDPDNIEAMDALQFISSKIGLPYKVFLISRKDFESVLQSYTGMTGEVNRALTQLGAEGLPSAAELEAFTDKDKEGDTNTGEEEVAVLKEDSPVTKMVGVILRHAIEQHASDIHIEHMGEKVRVRFRIDGALHTSLLLPAAVHSSIISRVKVLASLKLDERRKPQDGRFSTRIQKRKIDFRVSTFPAYYGEKIVMRILDSGKEIFTLETLGMRADDLEIVREAINHPYGMILLTGPTGSGKSTTLYAMLNELDRDTDNVISLEDPVEYSISGVSQSQVRPEIGYTFASGLRSILRQDPDVIMVGEIRDKETAQLAVQAALTGHLVFSTLHTNTSSGVITRLVDMGVDPFLLAPTLLLAIGQRLVSTLCPGAGKPVPFNEPMRIVAEREFENLPKEYREKIQYPEVVYEAIPTAECPTGVKGRIAVFELLSISPEIQEVILKEPIESDVLEIARKQGMFTMKEDAMMKAFEGKIPFVEVNKL